MSYTKSRSYTVPFKTYLDTNNAYSPNDFGEAPVAVTFTGDLNPLWRSQIRQGSNATTTASGVNVELNAGFIDFWAIMGAVDPNNHSRAHYGLLGIPRPNGWRSVEQPVPSDIITEVTNRAIRKFLDAADAARSSFEFGQDLGEWKETVRGITHPLQSLRDYTLSHLSKVSKLLRTVPRGRKNLINKVVADTWLEFKFGWMPLAQDVGQGIADLTNNRNHQSSQPIRASARGVFRDFESTNTGVSISVGSVRCRTRVTGYYFVTLKGAIRTGADSGSIGLAQNLQLDLPHFVPTVWDLLPYSWIVDYFLNVGDIIKSFSFRFSDMSWGCKTIRTVHQYDWTYYMTLDNFSPLVQYIISRNDTSVNPSGTVSSFQRTPLNSGDLIPQVRLSLPLGSEKPWENMAALLFGRQQDISRIARNNR
jgi:hypothetical protein